METNTVKELVYLDCGDDLKNSSDVLYNLSSRQMGLWIYQQKYVDSSLYNICTSFRVKSKASKEIIGELAKRVYDLHPAFRTRFTLDKGLPKQQILPEWKGKVDFSSRDDSVSLEQQIERYNKNPFDINGDVYCRLNIICCEDDSYAVQYSVHHILGDAKTGAIISDTLSDLFSSYLNGTPEPKIEYSEEDYISAILAYEEKNETAEQYWKNYLSDISLGLDLSHIPANLSQDHSEKAEIEDFKFTHEFSLDASVISDISRLTRQCRSTSFCFFSAIYGLLLSRCFRNENFAIGYVRDVRSSQANQIMGYFIEKLPLALNLQGNPTIRDLLQTIRTNLSAHKKVGNISSARIFELFDSTEDDMKNALNFNIGQAVFGGFDVKLSERECEIEPCYTTAGDTTSVLSFIMDISGSSGLFRFNYDSRVFCERTIHSMVDSLKTLVSQALLNPDMSIQQLELVSPEQYQEMAKGIAYQSCLYPHYDNIVEMFNERVETAPDLIAVIEENQNFTYDDIERMSNVVANVLQSKGVGANDQVGVCMNRSGVFMATMLGVLKLGATYIPLVPKLPHKRIQTIIEDSAIATVLTRPEFVDKFEGEMNVEVIDRYLENPAKEMLKKVEVCKQVDTAIVLYTSGSTGKPKGVELEHQGIINSVTSFYLNYPTNDEGRVLCRTSIAFDISLLELFGWFVGGHGAAFMLPNERDMDFKYMVNVINQFRLTHAVFVPSMLKPLLDEVQRDPLQPRFPSMRVIAAGGEKYPESLFKQVQDCQFGKTVFENIYGPTETSIYSTSYNISDWTGNESHLPVGKTINNISHFVLDEKLRLLPKGIPGEVCVGGIGVGKGYRNLPEKTAASFVANPYADNQFVRMYKTGDWGREQDDGNLEILGRFDEQVKLRGQRIELEEIETAALKLGAIQHAVAVVKETDLGEILVLYYSLQPPHATEATITKHLTELLPSYMVPQRLISMEKIPMLVSGKVDRKSLRSLPLVNASQRDKFNKADNVPPDLVKTSVDKGLPGIQKQLLNIWQSVLKATHLNLTDNFFEVGGHSLLVIEIVRRVEDELGIEMSITDFFRYPNIKELAQFLAPDSQHADIALVSNIVKQDIHEIAVIGIACRFPGAENKERFWRNLTDAKETIRTFSENELFEAGERPVDFEQPSYVRRRGLLDDATAFDNDVFNYTPREAEMIDPQQRLFLQEAYHALEDAGYGDTTQTQNVGVYGGAGFNDYAENVRQYAKDNKGISFYQVMTGNANDFLCTRVAYKLNLSGPAINVQTACSTSLVSIERACRDLRSGLCDMALAGGVSLIGGLEHVGYKYQNGMILSPDGHCRSFDAKAEGTVPSQGVGVVLLKPLQNAQEDGDNIYAVVKGVATNNDGKSKVGFTAPDVKGQSKVIQQAQQDAGIAPSDISYIEAHGTATPMGDPIEIAALNQAWQATSNAAENVRSRKVTLGSVKSNLGHADTAAGVAGFIKTALCLYHRQLVPTLHFAQPNKELHLEDTPFQVNTETCYWEAGEHQRRYAGVSAFGIGGTNAHVVLEEAPTPNQHSVDKFDAIQLLPVSAACLDSLDTESTELTEMLAQSSTNNWHNICYTAQVGRQDYASRACYVLQQKTALHEIEAMTLLNNADNPFKNVDQISFCFHGVVSQALAEHYFALYQHCFLYADLVNDILDEFGNQLGITLKPFFAGTAQMDWMNWGLERALLGFAAELGYAKLLAQAGVNLVSVIGNGGGELTASCFADAIDIKAVVNVLVRQQTDISVQVSLTTPSKPLYLSSAQTWLTDSSDCEVIFTRTEGAKNHINIDQVFEIADQSLVKVEAVLSFVNGDLFGAKTKVELDLFSFSTHPELYDLGATLYAMLGYWWLAGKSVNWMVLYPFGAPNRVSMPGYAFEKVPFFIKASTTPEQNTDTTQEAPPKEAPVELTPEYIEQVVSKIWCEHLSLSELSLDDDFFEIGGESLMAIGVFEDLEETLKVKLSVSSLYQASTLRLFIKLVLREVEFVSHLDDGDEVQPEPEEDTAPLVLLQKGTDISIEPIFMIHAAGGGVIHFSHLIKSLGERYTVYGFEAPSSMTFDSIESTAKCYLDALLRSFPVQESFVIGGHSFGPLVALEMGHQLNKLGKRIEKLLLIDPPGPDKMPQQAKHYSQILVHLCHGKANLDEQYMRYLSLEAQIEYMQRQTGEIIWKQNFYYITPAYIRRFKEQMDMMFDYEFKPLDCDSIYFTPTEFMPMLPEDMYESWYALTEGEMSVVTTQGNHITMVSLQGADTIADTLKSCL